MKWTYEHDMYLGREVLLIKPYQFKSGSKESGTAWTSIAKDLNKITEVKFNVSQKAVRDHCRNLLEKHKRKMRKEEGESGTTEEETELDNLLQNIKEEWEEAASEYDEQAKERLKLAETEKTNAEDIRQKAMESFAETRKRKNKEDVSPRSSKRNNGGETMLYLKNWAEQENS